MALAPGVRTGAGEPQVGVIVPRVGASPRP